MREGKETKETPYLQKLRGLQVLRRAMKYPTVFHDLGPKPVTINSEAHLKEECRKRRKTSVFLLNK